MTGCTVENIQDSVLLQHFIMEQLDSFQRYALKKQLFAFDNTYPEIVNGWLWLFCWVFTIAQWLFCTYWMFVWGVSNGSDMYATFFITFGLALVQDILIVQPAGVVLIFVTASVVMEDQLHHIRDVLVEVYLKQLKEAEVAGLSREGTGVGMVEVSPDVTHVDTKPIEAFQCFLSSCRVARYHVAYHLPSARVLRGIVDEDIFKCKKVLPGTREEKSYAGIVATIFITIPAIFAYMGDRSGDLVFQLILTTVIGVFLMANEMLLEVSLVAFIAFYLFVFGVIVYFNPDGWLCNLFSNCLLRVKTGMTPKRNETSQTTETALTVDTGEAGNRDLREVSEFEDDNSVGSYGEVEVDFLDEHPAVEGAEANSRPVQFAL